MSRLRNEDGVALISATILLVVFIGLGIGLLAFTDTQQQSATYEQSSEAAYSVAEAALNAQIFELASNWPTSASPYPSSCNPANAASTAGCPDPNSLASAYPKTGPSTCPSNSPQDAWNPSVQNQWTTYVRDDGGGTSQLFNSTTDSTQPTYDASGGTGNTPDGALWVRAVGVANCKQVVLISKVSQQVLPITLPAASVSANGFADSNNGNKVIVDTEGTYAQPSTAVANPSAQPGPVRMRCSGLTQSACKSYRSGQVSPDTTSATAANTPTFTSMQLAGLKAIAIANGTYWGPGSSNGTCPSSITQLTGDPVYVAGPCTLSYTGNGQANSSATPGFLVIANGTLELSGTTTFYGIVYDANQQAATGTPCNNSDVVYLHGNATLQGSIIVDGNGTVCFGSSGTNLIYDARGASDVKSWAGAAATPDSFRVLPAGQ